MDSHAEADSQKKGDKPQLRTRTAHIHLPGCVAVSLVTLIWISIRNFHMYGQVANLMVVDNPPPVGFSYCTTAGPTGERLTSFWMRVK